MKKNLIIGAAVVSMMAVGATGMAVASSSGSAEMPNPGEMTEGMVAAPQGGPESGSIEAGGKHAEKIAEVEQLLQYDEIGMDQAEQIATEQAPGEVIEVKLKEKDGYAAYEVETFGNGTITEFYINAQDGSILEQKVEGAEESGPMSDDEYGEMPEGPMSDDDDRDDERGPQGGPEAGTLPYTGGEEQE